MDVLVYILKLPYRLILLGYNRLILFFVFMGFVLKITKENIENEKNPEQAKKTNIELGLDALFNEDYGEYAKYKNNCNKILIDLGFTPQSAEYRHKNASINEEKNESIRKKDPLKKQGDSYETYIGKQFEKKGDLVVYNGMIHGHNDEGGDLVCFSKVNRTVNIIQCKNWRYRQFTLSNIEDIHNKLNIFEKNYMYSSLNQVESINFYLETPWVTRDILQLKSDLKNFKVYKTLYLSHENVVQPEVSEHIKKIKNNIFKYKNIKMVIAPMD